MQGPRLALSPELGSEVEKILTSETFRNSEALKRLLRFLADKTLAGESETLKEYTIGLDVIGKPPTYDPRSDSTVRIQVGRLRQKLIQYYRQEGTGNEWIVDLPKGQFGLTCEPAIKPQVQPPLEDPAIEKIQPVPQRRGLLVAGLALSLVAVTCVAGYLAYSLMNERRTSHEEATWTPELNELWRMFLDPRRPSLVSVLDHPMAAIPGFGVYADLQHQDWEGLVNSDTVKDLRKRYGDKGIRKLYLTPRHDLDTYFQLGKQLGPRVPSLSLVSTRDVSWQQMSDNNMIFIGSQEFYESFLKRLPVDLDFLFDRQGFRNVKPQGNEPALFLDLPPKEYEEDGESIAVVSHLPGPRGLGVVRTFGATRGGARLGAVEAFTEPQYAKSLLQKLQAASGKTPRFFQVVLKVKYKNGLPTDIQYMTHHELRAKSQAASY